MKDVHLIVTRVLMELFGMTNYPFFLKIFAQFTNMLTNWYYVYNDRCSHKKFVFFGTRLLPVIDDLLQIVSFEALDLIIRRLDLESILEPVGILKTLLEVSILCRSCASYEEILSVLRSSKNAMFIAQIKTSSEAIALHFWISRHFILFDFAFDLIHISFAPRLDEYKTYFKFLFTRSVSQWADKLFYSNPRWTDHQALDFLANFHVSQQQLVTAVYFTPDTVGGIAKKKFLLALRQQRQPNWLEWLKTNQITLYDVAMWLQLETVQKRHKKQMNATFFVIIAIIKLRKGKQKKQRMKKERKERKKALKEVVVVVEELMDQSPTYQEKVTKKTKSAKRKEQKDAKRLAKAKLRQETKNAEEKEEKEEGNQIVCETKENQIIAPSTSLPPSLPKHAEHEAKQKLFKLYCDYRFAMLLHERMCMATNYILSHFEGMSNSILKDVEVYRRALQTFLYPFEYCVNQQDPIPQLIDIAKKFKSADFKDSVKTWIDQETKSLERFRTCLLLFNAQRDVFDNLKNCLERVQCKTKGESRNELAVFYDPNYLQSFGKKDTVTLHNCVSFYPRVREMWEAIQSEYFLQFIMRWCDNVTFALTETETSKKQQMSLLEFLRIQCDAAKFVKQLNLENQRKDEEKTKKKKQQKHTNS